MKKEHPIFNVKVSESNKKRLDDAKIHPREPYNDVINRLLQIWDLMIKIRKDSKDDAPVDNLADYLNELREILKIL